MEVLNFHDDLFSRTNHPHKNKSLVKLNFYSEELFGHGSEFFQSRTSCVIFTYNQFVVILIAWGDSLRHFIILNSSC